MARCLVCRDKAEAPSEHHRLALLARPPQAQRLDTEERKTGECPQETDCREIAKERQGSDWAHQRAEACQHQQDEADPPAETCPQLMRRFIVSRCQGTRSE